MTGISKHIANDVTSQSLEQYRRQKVDHLGMHHVLKRVRQKFGFRKQEESKNTTHRLMYEGKSVIEKDEEDLLPLCMDRWRAFLDNCTMKELKTFKISLMNNSGGPSKRVGEAQKRIRRSQEREQLHYIILSARTQRLLRSYLHSGISRKSKKSG